MLSGKTILLIISGGIAAYKSLELSRRLREHGAKVRAVLTAGGAQFVTPLAVSSLTGEKAFTELFDLTAEAEIGHIELSRSADLVVVAPASADIMAKMAAGIADDLASTLLLATDKRVLIAPAMNVRMWQHPATDRNRTQLVADRVLFVGPNDGEMACGEFGPGRMAEPHEIVEAIEAALADSHPLKGRRALVTAGPTHEPIDPVRYIANRSSGKQGYAIAQALSALGAQTTLVSGPTALARPPGVRFIGVETAQEMLSACEAALPVDVAVCAAAVADWHVENVANAKLKKSAGGLPALKLAANPDILATLSAKSATRPALVVGFAAETENLLVNARAKREAKGCDWILANDVSAPTGVFGGDHNTVHLISDAGAEGWPTASKGDVARLLAARIARHFEGERA